MRTLYPAIEPYDTGRLKVSDVHEIYYEQCGNPKGKPVVFLHGGPGGGLVPEYRQFHDPAAYRIVLFDQRGSGRSAPHANIATACAPPTAYTSEDFQPAAVTPEARPTADAGVAA